MQVMHEVCCGLDVHKKSVTACVVWATGRRHQTREFETFTKDLLALSDWLRSCGVTHVAMESTGVYWKPVWNLLEGQFEVLLVNAQHIKAVPGRKTDQKDSEWIADLLQHGLLRPSFVPPTPIRELRDLTRYRASLAQEINRIANRIQKVLEDANIKLASVATDALGASGRAMLEAMVKGEQDSQRLAEMNMSQFPDAQHLASWAGLCPGAHESAGKRKSGKIRKGSLWLRRCLCQAVWAVSTKRNNYLSALYRRLAARRGKKRATIAVAHNLLVIAYYILRDQTCYRDLGPDYFDRINPVGLRRRLTKRLEGLGFKVTLEPVAQVA